jgi:DNA-binding SARP family transcriptional activator/TolB-like protein
LSPTSPSVRLRLFGGASLEDDHGPITGRGAQRRRIALLALLATARRPISRDKLVAYLWEEADTERARKLLSESLYVIRKTLGEDSLVTLGDAVQLNANVVWTDVAEFTAALERGDDKTALDLYRGPFLDGFFLSDALEFDNWVESERAALARSRAEGLARLAAAAESTGDLGAAVAWWRQLAGHDPYNSAYAIRLMHALDASGDRAGALQHARAHTALLRTEFDAEPDPQVEALAQSLQQAPTAAKPVPRVISAFEVSEHTVADRRIAERSATPLPRSPQTSSRSLRQRVSVWQMVAFLAILGGTGALVSQWAPAPVTRPAASKTALVAILPFNVHGSATELREGIADLLSTDLDGAGDLRSVDSHALLSLTAQDGKPITARRALHVAQRFAAAYYVVGDVTQGGNQLQVTATLHHAGTGSPIAHASARGPIDSLLTLVDRIATQLVVGRGGSAGELTQLAGATTRSYPALKYYLEGDAHYRAARYDSAVNSFQRALHQDRTFALAAYRLSAAAEWNFEFRRARAAAQRAVNNSARLPAQHQPLVRAWSYFLNGNVEAAQKTYESILSLYPNSVEARSGLAEVLVHFNPTRGLPQSAARDALARMRSLAPDYGEVRYHALEFAVRDKQLARFDSLLAGLEPDNPQYQSWRAVRAFTWGTRADQARVLTALRAADELAIGIAAARLAANAHDFAGGRTVAQELTRSHRTPQWQAGGHLLMAEILMADGHLAEAQRELGAAGAAERDWTVEMAALFSLHPLAASTREDLMREQTALLEWQPSTHSPSTTFFLATHATIHKHLRFYLLGLVAARLGDLDRAQTCRRELEKLGGGPESQKIAGALARSLAGHIARARGDRTQALALLTTASIDAPPEFVMLSPFYSRAHDRFVIAELHHELGNRVEASRWFGSLLDGYDFLYAPAARARLSAL